MPALDLSQFIDLNNPQSYYPPPANTPNPGFPTSGGNRTTTSRGILGYSDPLASAAFGLGMHRKTQWNPYIQGNQVMWANPNKSPFSNPVPVTGIPGAGQVPSQEYTQQANQIRAITDLLPYYMQATNAANLQGALGNLAVSQATSGPYAQLMTQLYNQYGPALNAIGNEINRRNALAQASTESQVMAGPGGDLVKQAYGLSQIYDQPYYQTRALEQQRLADLMNSVDLTGGLSGSELKAIQQGQARQNYMGGVANAPSVSQAVANTMQYGQAGYQRKMQQQSILSDAIGRASGFLPAAKSGVDVFQVATGRPSMPNPGAALFPGTQQGGGGGAALGSQLLGGLGQLQGLNTQTNIAQMQINAQKKDWADYLSQVTGSVGNLASSASALGLGFGCWIAREVYGNDNPKWIEFRRWMLQNATPQFVKNYIIYGPAIAEYIRNKPLLKSLIRNEMDRLIS